MKGDGGGGAIYDGLLVGVYNFGPNPCGKEGFPAGYAKVGYYKNWIEKEVVDAEFEE